MAQESVKLPIPFEALVDLAAKLSLGDKLRLWELLDKQLAQTEEETREQAPSLQTEIREARAAYHAGDYVEASKMEKLHLPIIIEMDEDGYYIVSCPLFRGCHSYGKTIDEALENIREAIEICLEETRVEELNKFVGFRELEIAQNA